MTGAAIFLDTSIQIARFFHAPELKKKIEETIGNYGSSATGLVVRQEFKRRVLKEAKYLLTCFHRLGSFIRVRRWVDSELPIQMNRKRNICIDLLDTIGEVTNRKESDADKTDRAKRLLEGLLDYGLLEFDSSVNYLFDVSGCACAKEEIRIDTNGKVDLGKERCSKMVGQCGIAAFLAQNASTLGTIRKCLSNTDPAELSDELRHSKEFIDGVLSDDSRIESRDPCTRVGDLLIALESQSVPTFYTLNEKESKILCPCLKQTLVVRPKNYNFSDRVTPAPSR